MNIFTAIKFESETLSLIDQRKLPLVRDWVQCETVAQVGAAITDMVVRGAPAIGCTAAYGLVIAAQKSSAESWSGFQSDFEEARDLLGKTRPTAVNLFHTLELFAHVTKQFADDMPMTRIRTQFEELANKIFEHDVATCRQIGRNGANLIAKEQVTVLTHCNTGSLATAGYGTALGVIRSLHSEGKLKEVIVDETRPYLQGTRLTTFELQEDGIPFRLIADSAAAFMMAQGSIDWAVTGADRIAANGDTANKIGTYSVAVNCKYHDIPFFIAAPLTTFDPSIASGADIPIEYRQADEVTQIAGHQLTEPSTPTSNPSFDVTPNELITGIITEVGVLTPPYTESIAQALAQSGDFTP